MNKRIRLYFLLGFLVTIYQSSFFYAQTIFADQAMEMGISHSMNNTDYWGAGISVFDIDNDGWDDITFARENDSIMIYRNVEGQFELMPFIFHSSGRVKSQLWVDYDNDGDNDFIISSQNGKIELYRQDDNWQFSEVDLPLNLNVLNSPNYGLSFSDYNLDGFLDLYISRYFYSINPIENPSIVNILLRNNGDGTFSDVTYNAGVQNGVKPSFIGCWIDINHDFYPDLYVINDRSVANNSLYLNNGNGTFSDISESSGTSLPQDEPMSLTFEDFNNDGLLDIFCSNSGTGPKLPRLLVNQGDNTFSEEAQQLGITMNEWSWGSTWIDVDNDTYRDLYITTGVISSIDGLDVRSYLYLNDGGTSFIDVPEAFSGNHIAPSFAVGKGDFNRDGFEDIVVQNTKDVNSFVWMNQLSLNGSNNYCKITLQGTESNRMAIGAWINLYAGGNRYVHYTRCGENYGSQNSQHYQFGLGNAMIIDSVVVEYPSGIVDRYYNLDINSHHFFIESETYVFPIAFNSSLTTCDTFSLVLDGGDFVEHYWNNGFSGRYLTPTESGYYWLEALSTSGVLLKSDTVFVNLILPPNYDYNINHISCNGYANGSIQIELDSSNPGSEVLWSNGQTGYTQGDLDAGSYSYSYSDFFGCTFANTIEILEPEELYLGLNQYYDGEYWDLSFLFFGGIPPYSLLMNGLEISTVINNVPPGEYLIELIDNIGCSSEMTLTLNTLSTNEMDNRRSVYPNPSRNGKFILNPNDFQDILVTNMEGRKVDFQFDKVNSLLDLSMNNKGVYLILISVDTFVYPIQVIFN